MAKHHGQRGQITVAGELIGHLQSWNIDEQAAVLEGYSMGDTWADNETGIRRWSGSLEAYFDPADAGQMEATPGDIVAVVFYPGGETSGLPLMSGNAIITGNPKSGSKDGWVTLTINFAGKGALAHATVT